MHTYVRMYVYTVSMCVYVCTYIIMKKARGATRLVIFTGNMNAIKYGKIIETGLVPFVKT